MNEISESSSRDEGLAANVDLTGDTAGAMLRRAREAAGIHVAALAVAMKVPVKKLEALEANRLDLLPDAVFVRALASSMCRALKIDATDILAKLPQTSVPRLNTEERGINAPFHTPGTPSGMTLSAFVLRPSVLAVIVLLVGILALVFLPDLQKKAHLEQVMRVEMPVTSVVTPADSQPAFPKEEQLTAATTPAPVPPSPVEPQSSSSPIDTANVAKQEVVAANVDKVEGSKPIAPPSGADLVVFRVRGSSWVEVTDAKGVIQLRRNLTPGDVAGAAGALPLSVVVGRADVTDVEVRGKPYVLTNVTKENVARFEVK